MKFEHVRFEFYFVVFQILYGSEINLAKAPQVTFDIYVFTWTKLMTCKNGMISSKN